MEGQRNNLLFRLSCEARRQGLPQEEVRQAVVNQLACAGFDAREIGLVVKSAYCRQQRENAVFPSGHRHITDKPPLGTEKDRDFDPEEDIQEQNLTGEALRERTPAFPEHIGELLPAFFKDGLRYMSDVRERDMPLLGMITVVSALLPRVTGLYDYKLYWPNLYTFVVAGAASNKGVLDYALSVCRVYFEEAIRRNEQLEQQYKTDKEVYEQACKQVSKTGGTAGTQTTPGRPQEPKYFYPHIPADISKARLLEHLRDNGDKGGLLFDTEADTLTGAGRQDYGNFFDSLRKFFHHEATSCSFKVNVRPIYLPRPRLSILLAGTPAQLGRMIPCSENGLYSRFLFYTHRQAPFWKGMSGNGDEEDQVERHFEALSHRLAQAVARLEQSPTRVRLTDAQWTRLNEVFSGLLQDTVLLEREDFQSCVKRHGLMAFRICMVFTALAKVEKGDTSEIVWCSPEHFEAALSVATTCLDHSRLLITSIRNADQDVSELQIPDKFSLIKERLARRFTTQEFMGVARELEIPARTAERLLKKAIGLKIKKISRGVYEITP